MDFAKRLIDWYLQNKRDLPWRETVDPYKIWLSEIMLQQTRVSQGMPYYFAFTEAFPTVFDLANADEQQVLKLWQGLGYYSRARNLHSTAKTIAFDYTGNFPESYKELLHLKGVGDYTAAAIASFSYGEAVPVVDGNVFRVLARYFDVETDIASPKAKKEFATLAFELMPKDNPAIFNQAIMEFGALQCVPKNPDCAVCPMNDSCLALQKGKVAKLPVKLKKQKVTNRYFNYLVYRDEKGNTLLQKREGKGIWQNLYEFPLIETDAEADLMMVSDKIENEILSISRINSVPIVHKLSHQQLFLTFWEVDVDGKLENGISTTEMMKFPVPIVLHNFMERYFGSEDLFSKPQRF
ncbi:A/G-specific adenine glycosylase [Flavobacterium sp. MAH-1]|uniref:Adenine DNA glycosylase n=1 Tax=Flavobacterium agri TaxID=2743471 RepID=A0A7Y8Y372_9FLAO|nr:A/G-specific adenine glycosylase [Flavobacterium agri]NUY81533.1 A/G-specific adenine glycosylase [Flavobacterium agri]NYA71557.1 A/G-specific adenine glycosylase [Flavobacterium agri]